MQNVRIIDTTLREGVQAPGVDFSAEDSLVIAQALAALGVDTIECGHPLKSRQELLRVQTLTEAKLGIPILAHSRAKMEDIKAVADSGAEWVGIFLGINHYTRTARLKDSTVRELLQKIDGSVAYAKSLNLKVRYTVEDASRTSVPDLQRAYAAAVDAGADRICFADTVGMLEPDAVRNVVSTIKLLFPDVDLEIHLHDDRGLAMANSLAAVDAGVDWVSTSVNGLGERCGITDTLALMANLHYRRIRRLREDNAPTLVQMSEMVESLSGQVVDARRPVIGRNAFKHKARLHRLAMERDNDAYTWFDKPSLIGGKIALVED